MIRWLTHKHLGPRSLTDMELHKGNRIILPSDDLNYKDIITKNIPRHVLESKLSTLTKITVIICCYLWCHKINKWMNKCIQTFSQWSRPLPPQTLVSAILLWLLFRLTHFTDFIWFKVCFRYFIFSHLTITLQKLWKISFISTKKLFPFHTFQIQKDKWKGNNLWCYELACIN